MAKIYPKTRLLAAFFLALLLALSCGELALKGPQGDQGPQGEQGRNAQAWLSSPEGQAWFLTATADAWQKWINSAEGKAWLASPAGQAWLASAAGQAWQAPASPSQPWLAQPDTQAWLASPAGQDWLAGALSQAWQDYINSPEGQARLASLAPQPDVRDWVSWLAGPEGMEWLLGPEGQAWLSGQLTHLDQPSPVASALPSQSVFSDVEYVYLVGSWNSGELPMASFSWEKESGPGSPAIASPASPVTAVSGLEIGEYAFKFTVFNLQGESDSADTAVTVSQKPPTYGFQEFFSDGVFTVPAKAQKIYVTACGGGAGGVANLKITGNGSDSVTLGGGGGGAVVKKEFDASPGSQIDIKIGAAGKGALLSKTKSQNSASYTPNTSGGDTVLTPLSYGISNPALLTLKGGLASGAAGGPGGGFASQGSHISGKQGITASGGSSLAYAGGGGGSLGGGGGAAEGTSTSTGGFSSFVSPSGAAANGGSSSAYCGGKGSLGGGGGASQYQASSDQFNLLSVNLAGGDGGAGYCLIEWWY